ncbi:RagB/SusD family nutrient uptake outer membrane protein [Algoriphagus algorifonticola]|uniref:RagB/SusD family nutrient uptake outer membrane protein n=1 Tax=Algoriphagus algorifonticola TaxID=2593007 RepID=UPI0011A67EC0|nr:RagB/SusD family nutrient uptake outer membrane protein [Algoriphagus algorifonticola]
MKKNIIKISKTVALAFAIGACNPLQLDEIQDPNNPSVGSVSNNASREQIQFLVTGLESRHRGYVTNISQAWNTFGREIWYLNASDPRFQTDWLGQNGRVPDRSYFGFGNTGGGSWAVPYQAIKQADVLITAAENTSNIPATSKSAVNGFAKTIQGFQFMIPANFVYQNGIRIDVKDPLNPGPFVSYTEALDAIKAILDQGEQDLIAAGSGNFPFTLTRGFDGFNTIDGLRRVNRAITARLNAYRKDWQGVLTALEGSFMNLNGNLNSGPSHPYGASPDIFNPLFYVPNAAINTIIVVHPSVLRDATPGDLRVANKFLQRTNPVTVTTDAGALVGTHQDARWASNTSPIPFIKNEELILLKAEAHANLNQSAQAIEAINIIRNAAGIGNYSGASTQAALIDEILYQRRYSLWAEPWGHRWIDARRYEKLSEIPTSFDGGTIFTQFPHPQAELSWDQYVGN